MYCVEFLICTYNCLRISVNVKFIAMNVGDAKLKNLDSEEKKFKFYNSRFYFFCEFQESCFFYKENSPESEKQSMN